MLWGVKEGHLVLGQKPNTESPSLQALGRDVGCLAQALAQGKLLAKHSPAALPVFMEGDAMSSGQDTKGSAWTFSASLMVSHSICCSSPSPRQVPAFSLLSG